MLLLRRLLAVLALSVGWTCVSAEPVGTAAQIIRQLEMQKIPDEGAWFALTYRSDDAMAPGSIDRYGKVPHVMGSAIYALATREDFSALHRLKTDEIWHYYGGDPLELLLLHPDGRGEIVVLGPDVLSGQRPQYTVRRGVWQGARPQRAAPDAYTLFGCTLAPSFEDSDFEMGYRTELERAYPKFTKEIRALTRAEFVERSAATSSDVVPAAAAPEVFALSEVPRINVAPGIELREVLGREAHVKTDSYSVASFTLAPGTAMPTSYNKNSKEVLLITQGRGTVSLGEHSHQVRVDSVVVIEPRREHSVQAAADSPLTFYAVSVPAFSADDYVIVKAR